MCMCMYMYMCMCMCMCVYVYVYRILCSSGLDMIVMNSWLHNKRKLVTARNAVTLTPSAIFPRERSVASHR